MKHSKVPTTVLIASALLCLGLPSPVLAQTSTSCAQIVRAANKAGAPGGQIEQAMETLQDLIKNHNLQVIEYAKVGKELVGLQNSTLFSGSAEANAADWISITNSSSVSEDELVKVIDSLSQYLRNSDGTALLGVEVPAASQDPFSLIKELVNAPRRTFFRASGPRSLVVNNVPIQGRAVTPGAFQAADVLVSTAAADGSTIIFAQGDLVLSGGTAGSDFVAFKEASSTWTESELTAAFQAIVNQSQVSVGGGLATVGSFTFVAENTVNLAQLVTSDTGVSVTAKLSELQAQLPARQQPQLDIKQTPF